MHGLSRGCTVAYGPHYGIVWTVGHLCAAPMRAPADAAHVTVHLFPILVAPRRCLATDFRLELAELAAARIELPQASLRLTALQRHSLSAVRRLGTLDLATLRRFIDAVGRAAADAAALAKYDAHGRHRKAAEGVPVRMHD